MKISTLHTISSLRLLGIAGAIIGILATEAFLHIKQTKDKKVQTHKERF